MRPVLFSFWAGISLLAQTSVPQQNPPPTYVGSSVVNAASPKGGGLAPNTLVTLYGQHLARGTRAVTSADIRAGVLPNALPDAGARVLVGPLIAPLLYISPTQINFLIPADIEPGRVGVRVALDGRYGPAAEVEIAPAAPALFMSDPEFAIAARAEDNTVVTFENPATPGGVVILYATGLGRMRPQPPSGQIVTAAAPLARITEFRVELDSKELDRSRILYAGAAPGFAGLYQINVRLPEDLADNALIRVGYAGQMSPEGVRLPIRKKP